MAPLNIKSVKKSYGPVQVVHGIDLDIHDNEFVVFVGPSGCGKSTLLRMIAGLEKTDEGTIEIGARDVTNLEPVERNVSMVFQSYALYPHMTVEQNMGFGLMANGTPADEVARRVSEAATSLQLTDYLHRRPRALSGGQRQRVAIGRAIVRNPDVFLFDEPLSNLDAELRVHMRVEILKLHQRLGATMIYVTHDQVEAMTLADKIVVLNGGRVMQAGTPMELFDDPDNLFVAGFIGSPKMNFTTVRVESLSQGSVTAALKFMGEKQIEISATGEGLHVGAEVTLGIRPEHCQLEGDAGTMLDMRVDVVERMGESCFLYGSSDAGEEIVVQRNSDRETQTGDVVRFVLPPEKLLLFNQDGARIR